MSMSTAALAALQEHIWSGSIPVEVTLSPTDSRTYDKTDPYHTLVPRLSYLPFILPRLHAYFKSALIDPTISISEAWLSFDGLPLKWHFPVGLLFDLHSGNEPADCPVGTVGQSLDNSVGDRRLLDGRIQLAGPGQDRLPWRLVLHYSEYPDEHLFPLDPEGKVLLDSFINNVKEADYIRNGSAKAVMSLGKADSDSLWRAVQTPSQLNGRVIRTVASTDDLALFRTIHSKLLNPTGQTLRHVPIKVYIPTPTQPSSSTTISNERNNDSSDPQSSGPQLHVQVQPASVRVIQGLVPLLNSSTKTPTLLGSALNTLIPTIFPDPKRVVVAKAVLHGAVVPLSARLDELGYAAGYADGFLHVVVYPVGDAGLQERDPIGR